MGRRMEAPLQVTDAVATHARTGGQFLLREGGLTPQLAQQLAEYGPGLAHGHSAEVRKLGDRCPVPDVSLKSSDRLRPNIGRRWARNGHAPSGETRPSEAC